MIASCGETVVLATAVGAKKVNPDVDYFPISVNYQENIMQQVKFRAVISKEKQGLLIMKH